MIAAVTQNANRELSGQPRERGADVLLTAFSDEGTHDVEPLEVLELRIRSAQEILCQAALRDSQFSVEAN